MWWTLVAPVDGPPIQLQANGRSGLPSDRRSTEDQHADKFSSAHHSRVPATNLAVAGRRQVHVAAAGVVLAPVHHVRLHTSTFQRPGANAIRSQHARASAKNPLPRVHRARCACGGWNITWHIPTALPPSLIPTCQGRARDIRTQGSYPVCGWTAMYAPAEHDHASIARPADAHRQNTDAPRCRRRPRWRGNGSRCRRRCCLR